MDSPIHAERYMRIICIGAGASGLCFAYKLQRSFHNFTLTVYEKNEGIAGVWRENTYPGCACDYEAHNYTYSWEPKPDWPSVYAKAPEIRKYFEDFAQKYALNQYCKTQHQVTGARWNDRDGVWQVQVRDLIIGSVINDTCDILINASGVLNAWRWPDIPGLKQFRGPLLHSAKWDEGVTLAGKRVGLIGNGSSGQQLIEALQPTVRHLTVFIRQPTWLLGPFGEEPRAYSEQEIDEFKTRPGLLLEKRKRFETRVNSYFGVCLKDSNTQAQIRDHLTCEMKKKLQNQDQEKLFIPDYGVGCRRPTPGVKYIESLTAENAEIVLGDIREVTANGVVDHHGKEHCFDILVCATGFDTSYKPRFPLVGLKGQNLQVEWSKDVKAYLAIAAPDMPNYFVFYGPNNPFASGAFLATVEFQAEYMLKFCDRWQTENIHSFSPKMEAVEDFLEHAAQVIDKTVWVDKCRSWYKSAPTNPRAVNLWPGSGLHYIEAISEVRADDWNITYKGNRFEWLGNGFSQAELDPTCDLAYYVRETDDGPFLSRAKRRKILTKSGQFNAKATPTGSFSLESMPKGREHSTRLDEVVAT